MVNEAPLMYGSSMKANHFSPLPVHGSQSPRRAFLKTSRTAAAATAVGSLDLVRSAYAAGNDTLRIGMIGCGGRNSGAAVQALTADPGARLVAMCDIFRDRIENKRAEIKA